MISENAILTFKGTKRRKLDVKKHIFSIIAIVSAAMLSAGCGMTEDKVKPEEEATAEEQVRVSAEEENSEEAQQETEEIQYIWMENPSWNYYIAEPADTAEASLKFTLLKQEKNQIIDEDAWFEKYGLSLPEQNDEGYFCDIYEGGTMLGIFKGGTQKAALDFTEYEYADDFKPEDKDFVQQLIHSAVVYEGILYVSTFHYTYAETSPHNGYITAVNLSDYSVLWKTEPLTCNSLNFEIIGNVILCGYGFTAEDDYLYQLDRETGQVIDRTPLASMANYIIYKDEKLFVRTYNTDYVFQVN